MNFDKKGLDERQRAYRDRIGYQCFLLLLYGILIDTVLHGVGVRWLPYPSNTMALLTVCAGIYQVRIILGNAHLPPRKKDKTIILMAVSVALAAVVAFFVIRASLPPAKDAAAESEISAIVLFIIAGVSLVVILVASLVQHSRDKERDEK